MGDLTQTTAQVQTDLNAVEASNAGLAAISDLSDTTATAAKKSGFHALQASSSNAPSTDRAVLISAVRDTAASSQIRYGQVAITESNGLWWNSDNNGTLGTWSQAATLNTAQTISGAKSITGNMTFNSATLDLNGNELILDADGDTSIHADTDDQFDVKIAGADDFQFTANTFTALSGSTIKANTIAETTAASGVTIDGVLLKDSTSKTGTLTVGSGSITDSGGSISFGNENLTTTGTLAAGVATLATGSTIGNLTLANGSITDSSGTISLGSTNLTLGSGDLTVSAGDVKISSGFLNLGGVSEVTIAAGAITASRSYHFVDTEGDAASDDLDTINGGSNGDLLIIRAVSSSRTVVAKDGTGNLNLAGDFTMDNATDSLTLIYDTTLGGVWVELSRSDSGA